MFRRYSTLILVMILSMVLSGCGSSGELLIKSSPKPTQPVNIQIKSDKSQYSKQDKIKLTVSFSFRNDEPKSAKVEFKSDALVKITGKTVFEYSDAANISDKTIDIELSGPFDTNGSGEIRAYLYTYNKDGKDQYFASASVYFNISDDEILLGGNGTEALRRQHLKNLLNSGKFTQREYNDAIDELSREGALLGSGVYRHGTLTLEATKNIMDTFFAGTSQALEGYYSKEIMLEKGTLTVEFKIETEEGSLELQLLDRSKNELVKTSKSLPGVTVNINEKGKHTLHVNGSNHTGRFRVEWKLLKADASAK